jgi:hypothetical protein
MTSVENMEAYLDACEASQDYKTKIMHLLGKIGTSTDVFTMEMKVDKTSHMFCMTVHMKGEKNWETGMIPLNTETDITWIDGKPMKVTITMHSDTMLMMQKKTKTHTAEQTMTVMGPTMTVTMTCDAVTCTEMFKKM